MFYKLKATYHKYILHFKQPSGTSRGVLTQRETWFIILEQNGRKGIGECAMLRGLSIDDRPDYEEKLQWVCKNIHLREEVLYKELLEFPSIQFGLETAFKSLESEDEFVLFPSKFTQGKASISINGLIWMGDKTFMQQQIKEKIQQGFRCIKMKIGAIDFQTEYELLKSIRNQFSADEIEIRVDANGAFSTQNALEKLKKLSELQLHSIEQPIKPNQVEEMARLCEFSPLPIALDEELIGIFDKTQKQQLIQTIKPQYIILKPSLVGGWKASEKWIQLAEKQEVGWWITSALESDVGLNAIAQWTFLKQNLKPQGLGTGSLYINNIPSPLTLKNGALHYKTDKNWKVTAIL